MLFSSVKVGEEDIVELPTSTTKLVSVSSVDVGKEGTSHGRDPVGLSSVKIGEDDMAYLPWRGDQVDAGFLHKDWWSRNNKKSYGRNPFEIGSSVKIYDEDMQEIP